MIVETLCREILKIANSAEEAKMLVQELTTVDWESYFLQYAHQYTKEQQRVNLQNNRTHPMNLEASLTLAQWIATLDYFGWRCAYGDHHFEVLDHFMPVAREGGTSVDNCIPACRECNSRKSDCHPDTLDAIFPPRNIARINFWLALNEPPRADQLLSIGGIIGTISA